MLYEVITPHRASSRHFCRQIKHMTQRIIAIDSPTFLRESDLVAGADIADSFPVRRPLALEIGCGTGHFLIEMARRYPEP